LRLDFEDIQTDTSRC